MDLFKLFAPETEADEEVKQTVPRIWPSVHYSVAGGFVEFLFPSSHEENLCKVDS